MRNPCQLYKGDLKKKKKSKHGWSSSELQHLTSTGDGGLFTCNPQGLTLKKTKNKKNFIVPEVTTSS